MNILEENYEWVKGMTEEQCIKWLEDFSKKSDAILVPHVEFEDGGKHAHDMWLWNYKQRKEGDYEYQAFKQHKYIAYKYDDAWHADLERGFEFWFSTNDIKKFVVYMKTYEWDHCIFTMPTDKYPNRISEQECKTMLENILNNAIENGEGFKISVNDLCIGSYRNMSKVKVAILTSEEYIPQIYIDKDYTVLDGETENVCLVDIDELLSWDRMSETHPFSEEYEGDLKEWELHLYEVNNIVGKLLLFYSVYGGGDYDFTWEKFLNDFNEDNEDRVLETEITYRSEKDKEIGDDEEVYILCCYKDLENKIEIEPFRNKEDFICCLYSDWDGSYYVKAKWGDVKNSI